MERNLAVDGQANCPICGAAVTKVLTTTLRRGTGRVLHCELCDHGFLQPDHAIDIVRFYAQDYRKEVAHKAEAQATNARELFDVYSRYQKSRLDLMDSVLQSDRQLLEVGASAGQFLVHVKDRVELVNAIELDRDCFAFLRDELGVDADLEVLEQSKFAGKTYDVVCAFQVMEHVEAPGAFLETLKAATRKGGTVFVEVPNLHDPLLTVWDVPEYHGFYYHSAHLHYFSEKSLRRAARSIGYRDDQITIVPTQDYNLLNHLHWVMNHGPQTDCHVGLSEVSVGGANAEVASWLTRELLDLNRRYVEKLVELGTTSNLMMILRDA